MPSGSSGGKPRGVYVVTDADLEGAVGGTFVVQPGPAIPVTGYTNSSRGVTGGKPMAVYEVDAEEVGRRGIVGGKPLPVSSIAATRRGASGPHIAVPVYVVSGVLTPPSPTPTPPVGGWWLTDTVLDTDTYAAYEAKGADDYSAATADRNGNPARALIEIAGAVPWSIAQGFMFDGVNHFSTTLIQPAASYTHIMRFRRPVHTGSATGLFGETPFSAIMTAVDDDTFSVWSDTNLMSWVPGGSLKDLTRDWVLGVAGSNLYGNGALVDVNPAPPFPIGGIDPMEVGGVLGAAGYIDIYALAMYSRILTGPEIIEITSQMQAL
jgi:hypothetical protein